MTRNPSPSQAAFTLLEVVAMLLVVTIGLLAVIGLFLHGTRTAALAQAASTAMPTAIAVAYDETPWQDPAFYEAADWTSTVTSAGRTDSGFINGYWVERVESWTTDDLVAQVAGNPVMYTSRVEVAVKDANRGATVASYATRLLRLDGRP